MILSQSGSPPRLSSAEERFHATVSVCADMMTSSRSVSGDRVAAPVSTRTLDVPNVTETSVAKPGKCVSSQGLARIR